MTDVPFPVLSRQDPEAEGVLSTWFVADGESVREYQVIAEVQVGKVAAEVPAPVDGTIRLLVKEGDAVRQGVAIAGII
jgi:pyruvate/2-oxoglutarate dehydrogenase complex dihydrolipoamide acyltransferase (E2) component